MQNPKFTQPAFYTSSNGDRWLVVRVGERDAIFVRHEPNRASGGQPSEVDIETFMARGPDSPEGKALIDLLDRLRAEQVREGMEKPGGR